MYAVLNKGTIKNLIMLYIPTAKVMPTQSSAKLSIFCTSLLSLLINSAYKGEAVVFYS